MSAQGGRMMRTFAITAAAALLLTIPGGTRVGGEPLTTDQTRFAQDERAPASREAAPSETATDRALTREIRQAITTDDSLSTSARNVTVITSGGVVTLRGPVANEQERNAVAAKAEGTTGVKRLDNQLEVAGPNS
jgi:hyperosmotically inducible periplasmic protein